VANAKISALPAVSTPIAGTEVLPIVQSTTTKKVSVVEMQAAPFSAQSANGVAFLNSSKVLTAGTLLTFDGSRLDVTGEVRASVGVLFGTDTAAANTLDDYEEGTWTPTFINVTAPTYTTQTGKYVKVGKICYFTLRVVYSVLDTTDTSALGLTLPFTPEGTEQGNVQLAGGTTSSGFAGAATLNPTAIITSAASFTFAGLNNADTYDYNSGNWNAAGSLVVSGVYYTA